MLLHGDRSRGQQLESRRREEEEQRAADRAFADAWSMRLKELKQEEVGTGTMAQTQRQWEMQIAEPLHHQAETVHLCLLNG